MGTESGPDLNGWSLDGAPPETGHLLLEPLVVRQ